jgi:hypothetical protein
MRAGAEGINRFEQDSMDTYNAARDQTSKMILSDHAFWDGYDKAADKGAYVDSYLQSNPDLANRLTAINGGIPVTAADAQNIMGNIRKEGDAGFQLRQGLKQMYPDMDDAAIDALVNAPVEAMLRDAGYILKSNPDGTLSVEKDPTFGVAQYEPNISELDSEEAISLANTPLVDGKPSAAQKRLIKDLVNANDYSRLPYYADTPLWPEIEKSFIAAKGTTTVGARSNGGSFHDDKYPNLDSAYSSGKLVMAEGGYYRVTARARSTSGSDHYEYTLLSLDGTKSIAADSRGNDLWRRIPLGAATFGASELFED